MSLASVFFDEWNDDDWCSFDNYMLSNLQYYIVNGLVKSDFQNLAIRKLASETCHEFIEWVGLVDGTKASDLVVYDRRMFKDELYGDFVQDNPDFAPKAKMTISRQLFYKWLVYFGNYKKDIIVEEGRTGLGRWVMYKTKDYEEKNEDPSFQF
jgi:hypothetical protein